MLNYLKNFFLAKIAHSFQILTKTEQYERSFTLNLLKIATSRKCAEISLKVLSVGLKLFQGDSILSSGRSVCYGN